MYFLEKRNNIKSKKEYKNNFIWYKCSKGNKSKQNDGA